MAFHPYPQLIPRVFNPGGCGPPRRLTTASAWPWVDHPASGPQHATHALFRLAFATHPPHGLSTPRITDSQAHSSKGTPSPRQGSDGSQASGFRHSFTPLPGYFSPFPHGTLHYRSTGSIQAYQVVLADSHEIPRAPRYSGTHTTHTHAQHLPGSHGLWPAIPDDSPPTRTRMPAPGRRRPHEPHNPAHATPADLSTHTV